MLENLKQEMEVNRALDRLTIQINSFQEGFEILSQSRDLTALGKNFCHILRGSLMSTFVNLYYKSPGFEHFTPAFEQNKQARPDLALISDREDVSIYPSG